MTEQKIIKMKKKEEVEIKNDLIEAVKSKKTFTEIGINDQLVKAVTELGYTHATEIQERSILMMEEIKNRSFYLLNSHCYLLRVQKGSQ